MLAVIPKNSYPLKPSGYAQYWQAVKMNVRMNLLTRGRIPVWNVFHDGAGEGRIVSVLLVRVRPDIEVVLIGEFSNKIVSVHDAIRKRLSMPKWLERNWYVSHLVYLAQPQKRKGTSKKAVSEFNFERFCYGSLIVRPNQSYLLAFVPVPRLKVVIIPSTQSAVDKANPAKNPDVGFYVDRSKAYRRRLRAFVDGLSDLERWERRIVHRGLGHLLGPSYVNAMTDAVMEFTAVIGGQEPATEKSAKYDDKKGGKSASSNSVLELLSDQAEGFEPVSWLNEPDVEGGDLFHQAWLGMSRFPMGGGPDLELALRPSIPRELVSVIRPIVPRLPYVNEAVEFVPDPRSGQVKYRMILNPFAPYMAHLQQ